MNLVCAWVGVKCVTAMIWVCTVFWVGFGVLFTC